MYVPQSHKLFGQRPNLLGQRLKLLGQRPNLLGSRPNLLQAMPHHLVGKAQPSWGEAHCLRHPFCFMGGEVLKWKLKSHARVIIMSGLWRQVMVACCASLTPASRPTKLPVLEEQVPRPRRTSFLA